jgi:hypothetical protein
MKYLLLACCLLLATAAHAQKKTTPPPPAAPIVYCMLVVDGSYFSSTTLRLDYGQGQKFPIQDASLAETAEQVNRFTSVPAGLNYLYSVGWECVQTATLPNETSSHYAEGQIGYLMRRRTP